MADRWISFDTTAPAGSKLPPWVIAEIQTVAPSAVNDNSISTNKIQDEAVTRDKITPGAIDTSRLSNNAVTSATIASEAVTTAKIAPGAIVPSKAGTGMVTAKDSAGNVRALTAIVLTAAQYAALSSPDPNAWYLTT